MKIIRWKWILTLSLCLLVKNSLGAEPRTWTDTKGRKISASFVKADDRGTVTMKQADGKEVLVSALALSLADRTWLRLQGVKTGGNELMEYLLRNDEIVSKLSSLYPAVGKAKDDAQRDAIRKEIDDLLKEREGFQAGAFDILKLYLPVETPPFANYKQEFTLVSALTWTLRDKDNKQLGYVSLSYNIKDDWNKKLKNSAKNTEQLGIPFRGDWFFFSDNTLLQIALRNPALDKDQALDAFMQQADIKGLYTLGGWK